MVKKYTKYSNRKIYCNTKKRYVPIRRVYQDILEGSEIMVIRKDDSEDITNQVLSSIIQQYYLCKFVGTDYAEKDKQEVIAQGHRIIRALPVLDLDLNRPSYLREESCRKKSYAKTAQASPYTSHH